VQVIETTGRIQNVQRREGALSGAQNVGEAEASLVRVPGTDGRRRHGVVACAVGEPEHEHGVDVADEGRGALDGSLLARR
jgi:hypothetical protein